MATAKIMLKTRRFIYAVFMCHLASEKLLKGLYAKKTGQNPPKTHDLVFLTSLTGINLPIELKDFIDYLNGLSVPTRYPDELAKLLKEYTQKRTTEIVLKTQKLLLWLKKNC
ncbi:MAG: HEPN domain-containing protein [Planctomycetes bacterium]|nr:HEPN domain-containing protein [Planctomycetota bacterium]